MKKCIVIIIFIIVAFSKSNLHSQSNYRIKQFTLQDGLSQVTINDLQFDTSGFLWIATQDGVDRFDGQVFYEFKHNKRDSLSLTNNKPLCTELDHRNRIWIGYQAGGLSYYEPERNEFRSIEAISQETSVNDIYFDPDKNHLWVATSSQGLIQVDLNSENYQSTNYLENITVSSIQKFDKKLYLGSNEGSIYSTNLDSELNFTLVSNISSKINAFHGFQNKLFIGAVDGLFAMNTANQDIYRIDLEDNSFAITKHVAAFSTNSSGDIWIGSGNGLFLFNPHTETTVGKISNVELNGQSLSNNTIQSMASIDNNKLAVGTANGLNIIDFTNPRFKNYSRNRLGQFVLNDNVIFAILKHKGDLWVGTTDGGVNLIRDGQSYQYYAAEKLGRNIEGTVRAIKADKSENRLWIATTRGLHRTTLNFEDPTKIEFISYFHDANDPNSISLDFIKDIDIDDNGTVWAATSGAGVFSLTLDQNEIPVIKRYHAADLGNSIVGNLGQTIACYKDEVWVGFTNGLSIIRAEGIKNYQHQNGNPESISHNSILDILFDNDGTPWLACENGINRSQGNGIFKNWIAEESHPETIFYALQDDEEGNIWIGSNDGLFEFNPKTAEFTQFTSADGIQGDEFDIHARHRDNEGNIYMGGIYGLSYFKPKDLIGIDEPHTLYFTDLILKGEKVSRSVSNKHLNSLSISTASEVSVWKNDFPFNLKFSSIDYDYHSNYDFAYRLLPSNEEWTFLDKNEKQIQFVNLPAGKKDLEITAFARGSQWENSPLSIKLNIIPVWWKRWWAILLFALLLLALLRRLYQYQLARNVIIGEHRRLKEVDEMKNNFYANISHEFRTPLTIIMGMLENLKSDNLPQKTTKDLGLIEKNSKKLLKLVNDILGLAKLENSTISLNLTRDNVIPLVSYCVDSMQALADSKKIDLVFYPEDEFIEMDFDPERLSTIVTNLISNAIKFTKEGGQVFVHTHRLNEEKKDALSIKVKDNGLGIPEDDLPHIFKKYFQSQSKSEISEKGTGIGLALTKELLRAMNGSITVESKLGIGTTFNIQIPITQNAETEQLDFFRSDESYGSEQKIAPIDTEVNADKALVLLVEDNADVASYIISCLTNFNVILANNGRKGIEIAESHIPDIVISDVVMPEVGGYQLCDQLKSNVKTDHIPIILLSAKAEENDKILGFEHGADAYITKPFSKIELLSRINQLLHSRDKLLNKVKNQGIESLMREKQKDPNLKFLQKAVNIIHANMDNTVFGPPLFAKKMGMSESQLYKKLKATTGKSTALFIRSIRLEKAKMLLLSTKKSISEISYDTGFNDPSWFSRAFKLEFGFTPSEIEKLGKTDTNN